MLIVIGTVALIAMPRQVASIERRRMMLVERQVVEAHLLASRLARTTMLDIAIRFDRVEGTMTVEGSPAEDAAVYGLPFVLDLDAAPFGATIVKVEPRENYAFDRWGRADESGIGVSVVVGSLSAKILMPE